MITFDAVRNFRIGHLRHALVLSAGLAAGIAVTPVSAEIYKWVDADGVTHYSDQTPAKGKSAKKPEVVPERLSVYSSSPAPSSLLAPVSYSNPDPGLRDRIDALERQLQAERQARDYMAAGDARALLAAYERCLADRRVDCDAYGGLYPPYAAPVIVTPFRHRRLPFIQNSSLTGITAGNIVGPGIIPGNFNGAGAVTAGNFATFRPTATRGTRGPGGFVLR